MVSGFAISEILTPPRILSYSREKRMLEKRIQYFRARGDADNSPNLINRLARLDDLLQRLIPNGEKGRVPVKKLPYHCIW